jgi:hypothetical protein
MVSQMRRLWVVVAWAASACGGTVVSGEQPGNPPAAQHNAAAGSGAASGSDGVGGVPGAAGLPGGTTTEFGSGGYSGRRGALPSIAGAAGEVEDAAGESGADGSGDCGSPPLTPLAPWQTAGPNDDAAAQAIATAKASLVGNWQGIATNEWVPPFAIYLSFDGAGGYSSRCQQNSEASTAGCCVALYYGTDRDSSLKRWTLSSVDLAGKVSGNIDIVYYYGSDGSAVSGYQGSISGLEFDATGSRAHFQFVYGDRAAGTYELQRLPDSP